MNDPVRLEIEALRTLNTRALKARYRELFGEDSRSSNQAYLFRRLAWRVQALAKGDLSKQARQRADELACDADLRVRPPRTFRGELEGTTAVQRDPRLPAAGSELTRMYRGRLIVVKVLEHGFEYKGRHFTTLSAIASQATGTRWNGFSFFGLNTEVRNG